MKLFWKRFAGLSSIKVDLEIPKPLKKLQENFRYFNIFILVKKSKQASPGKLLAHDSDRKPAPTMSLCRCFKGTNKLKGFLSKRLLKQHQEI